MIFNIYSQYFIFFNFSQYQTAALIDYFLKRFFAVDLDQNVSVQETAGQIFCQNYSCSALPGARHADKSDIGFQPGLSGGCFRKFSTAPAHTSYPLQLTWTPSSSRYSLTGPETGYINRL